MANSMVWSGMKEYLEELRKLPEDCRNEAAKLVEGEANAAYVAIAQVYEAHKFTGTLRKRLTLSALKVSGVMTTGVVLKSGSPIAWLFDNGSQTRNWKSGKSTGAMGSKSPPTHIFSRTVGKTRRTLTQRYRDMLRRRGAVSVTGE